MPSSPFYGQDPDAVREAMERYAETVKARSPQPQPKDTRLEALRELLAWVRDESRYASDNSGPDNEIFFEDLERRLVDIIG